MYLSTVLLLANDSCNLTSLQTFSKENWLIWRCSWINFHFSDTNILESFSCFQEILSFFLVEESTSWGGKKRFDLRLNTAKMLWTHMRSHTRSHHLDKRKKSGSSGRHVSTLMSPPLLVFVLDHVCMFASVYIYVLLHTKRNNWLSLPMCVYTGGWGCGAGLGVSQENLSTTIRGTMRWKTVKLERRCVFTGEELE